MLSYSSSRKSSRMSSVLTSSALKRDIYFHSIMFHKLSLIPVFSRTFHKMRRGISGVWRASSRRCVQRVSDKSCEAEVCLSGERRSRSQHSSLTSARLQKPASCWVFNIECSWGKQIGQQKLSRVNYLKAPVHLDGGLKLQLCRKTHENSSTLLQHLHFHFFA